MLKNAQWKYFKWTRCKIKYKRYALAVLRLPYEGSLGSGKFWGISCPCNCSRSTNCCRWNFVACLLVIDATATPDEMISTTTINVRIMWTARSSGRIIVASFKRRNKMRGNWGRTVRSRKPASSGTYKCNEKLWWKRRLPIPTYYTCNIFSTFIN